MNDSCWVQTDFQGRIANLSVDAAALLAVRPRGALGRSILPFFGGDRTTVLRDMASVAELGGRVTKTRILWPKEHVPFSLIVMLRRPSQDVGLCWIFDRASRAGVLTCGDVFDSEAT